MADQTVVRSLEKHALEVRKKICLLAAHVDVHIGGDMSMVDMMTALYLYKMNWNPKVAKDPKRDRFALSKGHGAACQYAVMAQAGDGDWDEIVRTWNQYGSKYGMHPCKVQNPMLEISSGSLGHGTVLCSGMALAARLKGETHRVYTLLGDGELTEGSVWEGAMIASKLKLVALVDRNHMGLCGSTEDEYIGMALEPLDEKWRSFGWNVIKINGHDMNEIVDAYDAIPPVDSDKPTVIIGETIKGKGIPFLEGRPESHNGTLNQEQLKEVLEALEASV